jgi:hypothetical protein
VHEEREERKIEHLVSKEENIICTLSIVKFRKLNIAKVAQH